MSATHPTFEEALTRFSALAHDKKASFISDCLDFGVVQSLRGEQLLDGRRSFTAVSYPLVHGKPSIAARGAQSPEMACFHVAWQTAILPIGTTGSVGMARKCLHFYGIHVFC